MFGRLYRNRSNRDGTTDWINAPRPGDAQCPMDGPDQRFVPGRWWSDFVGVIRPYHRSCYRLTREPADRQPECTRTPGNRDHYGQCRRRPRPDNAARVRNHRHHRSRMITFHQRVALVSSQGDHIRYIHSSMASAMVLGGGAQIPPPSAGRVRSITLNRTAELMAHRVGPPSEPGISSPKFFRSVRLDQSASRVFEHHPRCLY